MYLVFMGSELRSPRHILSYSSQTSTQFFHAIFYSLLFCPLTLTHEFFLTFLHPLCLSPTLLGFLSAGLLSDREGFVRCQIPELRDQRQTKRLVTYCSILERQKNGIPHRTGHHILPPFLLWQLFHPFNPPH